MKLHWKLLGLLLFILVLGACAGPSKAELATIQSSKGKVIEALVKTYQDKNEKLFIKLAMPYEGLQTFMSTLELPPGADVTQQLELNKSEFKEKVVSSFRSVVETEDFLTGQLVLGEVATMNEVPMGDYSVEMLQIDLKSAQQVFTQNITLITAPDGRIWLADIFPLAQKND